MSNLELQAQKAMFFFFFFSIIGNPLFRCVYIITLSGLKNAIITKLNFASHIFI